MFGHLKRHRMKYSANSEENYNDHDERNRTTQSEANDRLSKSKNLDTFMPFCFHFFNLITPLTLTRSFISRTGQFISLFKFIFINCLLINLFISRCHCQARYFLPSHYDFRVCSSGFRISVYSVESFNSSSGKAKR